MRLVLVGACAVIAALMGMWGPRLIARLPTPRLPDNYEGPTLQAVASMPRLGVRMAVWASVLAMIAAWHLGAHLAFIWLVPWVAWGVWLAHIDIHARLLPRSLVSPAYLGVGALMVTATLATGDHSELVRAVGGWAVFGGVLGVMWLISPGSMGYGDVRVAGVLGLVLGYQGWPELALGIFLGPLIMTLWMLAKAIGTRDLSYLRARVPYGPALLGGAWLGLVCGADIARWYLGLGG